MRARRLAGRTLAEAETVGRLGTMGGEETVLSVSVVGRMLLVGRGLHHAQGGYA